MTPADRIRIQRRFSTAIANLGTFRAYWLPTQARPSFRSESCVRHFRLPEPALFVGTYSGPFSARAFLDDLDEAIRRSAY